jgi:acetyl-CoA carboxylase carboxyl transferase subunit alpha
MWRDASKRAQAAEALKITSEDVRSLGCVDDVVPEPLGGAHIDPPGAAALLDARLQWHLEELRSMPVDEMVARRFAKFRNIAQFYTS